MKILFLSIEYPPETGGGGIGSYVASIAPALVSRGHEVHVLSCADGQTSRDYLDKGVHIHRRGIRQIPGFGLLSRLLRLSRAFGRFHNGLSTFLEYRRLDIDFDVIEHPDWGAEGWLFALLHTKPLVAHLHTPFPLILRYNQLPKTIDGFFTTILEQFAVRRSDAITSPSQTLVTAAREIGWLQGKSVRIIPHPVDWPNWNNATPVSKSPPTVLFVGRIEHLKAPELVAQAISIIQKEVPEAKALFVGMSKGEREGLPYLEWIRKIAGNGESCEFLDQVPRDKLVSLFSRSRVLALPSWFESYGIVVLEAMAAGRPVVVTQTTGAAEFVSFTKLGGVVPPGTPEALAEALRPFLLDSTHAERIGQQAKDAVRKSLDPDRIAGQREAIYKKAIEVFDKRLRSKTLGFRFAMPEKVTTFRIPKEWGAWAVSETIKNPWKHFYLHTARQVLELLAHTTSFTKFPNLQGMSVLDVGSTPAVSLLLACLGAKVTMLDIDPAELRKGERYADLLGVAGNVRYICADAFKIPVKPYAFDVVWNSGFLEHFHNPKQILKQMGHVLRPRGVLIVLVPNRWTPHSLWIRDGLRAKPGGYDWDNMGRERSYTRRQLIRLLYDASFQVIASSTSNLRRSILDDSVVLSHLRYLTIRGLLFRAMNAIDWMENHIPFLRHLGFMVGAAATPAPEE